MTDSESTNPESKAPRIVGVILGGLAALFLAFGGIMNLAQPAAVVESAGKYGYSQSALAPLGVVVLVCALLYLVPQTALLGAILLTGYLGGAVATHVIAGEGPFEILFPVVFASFLWGGLLLRDRRLRSLIFWRT